MSRKKKTRWYFLINNNQSSDSRKETNVCVDNTDNQQPTLLLWRKFFDKFVRTFQNNYKITCSEVDLSCSNSSENLRLFYKMNRFSLVQWVIQDVQGDRNIALPLRPCFYFNRYVLLCGWLIIFDRNHGLIKMKYFCRGTNYKLVSIKKQTEEKMWSMKKDGKFQAWKWHGKNTG